MGYLLPAAVHLLVFDASLPVRRGRRIHDDEIVVWQSSNISVKMFEAC
jgi:hypothetical protein